MACTSALRVATQTARRAGVLVDAGATTEVGLGDLSRWHAGQGHKESRECACSAEQIPTCCTLYLLLTTQSLLVSMRMLCPCACRFSGIEWMWKHLVGLKPAAPAFAEVVVAPRVHPKYGPRPVTGDFLSTSGAISSAWGLGPHGTKVS